MSRSKDRGPAHSSGALEDERPQPGSQRVVEPRPVDPWAYLLRNSGVGVAVLTVDGAFLRFNEEFCRMVGYTHEELRSVDLHAADDETDLTGLLGILHELRDSRRPYIRYRELYIDRSHGGMPAVVTGFAVLDDGGEPRFFVVQAYPSATGEPPRVALAPDASPAQVGVRVTDRLRDTRHRVFVGREQQLADVSRLIAARSWVYQVLYVYGEGGVGKTALLDRYGDLFGAMGIRRHVVDAREVAADPATVERAFRERIGLAQTQSLWRDAWRLMSDRWVLMIDNFDNWRPIEQWLATRFVPELPANCLVVLAGRRPPGASWRRDPAWAERLHTQRLLRLDTAEVSQYLHLRGVPATKHQAIHEFTHGNPRALSLLCDRFAQDNDFELTPERSRGLSASLLSTFVQEAATPTQSRTLELASIVHDTTEDVLAAVLQDDQQAAAAFQWLRERSFMQPGPRGLRPTPLARDAIFADLRWRNPARHRALVRDVSRAYAQDVPDASGHQLRAIIFAYLYAQRHRRGIRRFFDTSRARTVRLVESADHDAVVAMTLHHEGKSRAEEIRQWLSHPDGHFYVCEKPSGEIEGYVGIANLRPERSQPQPPNRFWQRVGRHISSLGVLGPDGCGCAVVGWAEEEGHQRVSPVETALFACVLVAWSEAPTLRCGLMTFADPDFWRPLMSALGFHLLDLTGSQADARRPSLFLREWRQTSPRDWLQELMRNELAVRWLPAPRASSPTYPSELTDRDSYYRAVRHAIREFTRPWALHGSPLLYSRAVAARVGSGAAPADRIEALRAMLTEAIDALSGAPKAAKFSKALRATYFGDNATQEEAAEALDLPFSTYRRYLTRGIAQVAEYLWQDEANTR